MKHLISFRILLTLTLLIGAMSVASASDRFYLDPVNIEAGETKTLSFNLENEQVFYGFQVDIVFPDGIQLETNSNGKFDCSLSQRFDSSYSLFNNSLADGSIRFGAFSSNHAAISGSNGAVLLVKVRASDNFEGGTLYIKNTYFVGTGDIDVVLDDYSVSLGNQHNNECYIQDFRIEVGETKTVSLELNNETSFSSFQADLYMPDGIIMSDCSVSERGVDHTVSVKHFSDGRVRVACMSLSNSVFYGNSGSILNIQLTATKDAAVSSVIQINNIRFTTKDAREYILPNSNTNVNIGRDLVTEIQLNYNSLNLVVGEHQLLQATVLPAYATTKDIEWLSENTNVATVSETGCITAVGVGSTKITARAVDGSGVKAYCFVDVKGISVSQIQLPQDYLEMEANENYQLTYSILPTNATDKTVTWSSSNQDVAIIDNNGMIRTLNIGETIIKVASNSNPDVNAICKLVVIPTLVESISITPNNISLHVGQTATLNTTITPDSATDKKVAWASDNESVVIVSDLGVVSAISIGSANIIVTAKDESGVFAKCLVNVVPTIAESIQIDEPVSTSLKVGEKIQLTATVYPESTTDKSIIWSSSNEIIASVDNYGIVTAISEGNVTITATNSAGQTDEINLVITNNYTINVSANIAEAGTISGGGEYQDGTSVTVTAIPNEGYKFISWTEDDEVVSEDSEYTFVVSEDRDLVANFSENTNTNINHWMPDETLYPTNMAITAVVQLDGVEQRTADIEIAAFCENELRGSNRLKYEDGTLDRYFLYLTVYGEAGDVMSFKIYDHATASELDLHYNETISFTVNGNVGTIIKPHVFNFTSEIIHQRALTANWNWYSTYVNVYGEDAFEMITNSLGDAAEQLKTQLAFTNYYPELGWYGALETLDPREMCMIDMSEPMTLKMSGFEINPEEFPITLSTNWKWISYPITEEMDVAKALSNITPNDGDMIKSQTGFSQYYESLGWRGSLMTMIPGQGYMYQNTSGTEKTLYYPSSNGSKSELKANVTTENNYWKPEVGKYPTNMSVVAIVDTDVYSDYEVAAFSNGECRGSARPIYIEELDRNIIFLTIYGEDEDTINLKYYDVINEKEYDIKNTFVFGIDATIGNIVEPYVISLIPSNLEEISKNAFGVYPNPVNTNTEIHLAKICDKVWVYNTLGVKIAEYDNVNHIKGIEISGAYVIKIVDEGVIKYDRIIVR